MQSTLVNKLYQQRARCLTILLFVSLLLILFCAIKQWYQDWRLINNTYMTPMRLLARSSAANINLIPAAHLFGQHLLNDVPISQLQYHVTGIVKVDKDNGGSKAYVATADQAAKIYRVGDVLPSGIKIHAILADAVILDNDGEFEKLPLLRSKLIFKPKPQKEVE